MKPLMILFKKISYNSEFPNQEFLSMGENISIPSYNIAIFQDTGKKKEKGLPASREKTYHPKDQKLE